jgi:hypothetical protein
MRQRGKVVSDKTLSEASINDNYIGVTAKPNIYPEDDKEIHDISMGTFGLLSMANKIYRDMAY